MTRMKASRTKTAATVMAMITPEIRMAGVRRRTTSGETIPAMIARIQVPPQFDFFAGLISNENDRLFL